jgi:hypothetical protein
MQKIATGTIWMGRVDEVRDLVGLLDRGIVAVIDLAGDERPIDLVRELVYCRFPLLDGAGNEPWLLLLAARTIAELIDAGAPTLVCCGAGMSRTPALVAAALAISTGRPPEECLAGVAASRPSDISPGLWTDLVRSLDRRSGNGEAPRSP